MPKRKRDADVDEVVEKITTELFRALKAVKAFERQRQAKRIRQQPEKAERVQKEIVVLKSLDLHQAAKALLCNTLLKFKDVANSPRLPQALRDGAVKPNVSEEEKSLLHNVTSNLYHFPQVREVVDRSIVAVCNALRVPVPEKGKKNSKSKDAEVDSQREPKKEKRRDTNAGGDERRKESHDASDTRAETAQPEDDLDDEEQERAVTQLEGLLGGSDDSDSEADGEDVDREDTDELDPMAITSDEGEEEDEFEGFSSGDDLEQEEDSEDHDTVQEEMSAAESSEDDAPPPKKAATVSKKAAKLTKPSDSMFLPTLMSGYVSGSESASDVDGDIAPIRKNRRGQRARQAIWEQRYKDKAKHITEGKKAGGKDAGWDAKRGAVGKDDVGRPWKRGVRAPLERQKGPDRQIRENQTEIKQPVKEHKRDDSGPIHPSWEAAKKAKEKSLTAPFQGKKITFD